jgi:hypothetical protein
MTKGASVKKLGRYLSGAGKRVTLAGVRLYRRYPARANSYIAAALVAVGSALGVVIAPESAGTAVALVVPILLGGEATHRLVTPASRRR